MADLIKLLPEGASVVAVIVIVVLFLKQQRDQTTQNTALVESGRTRMEGIANNFQGQVDRLAQQIFNNQTQNQERIQKLFDSFMTVSKDVIEALAKLKDVGPK